MNETKILPHDKQIERSIIAAVMMEPYLIDAARSRGVVSEMFFDRQNFALWTACEKIYDRAGELDVALLSDELQGRDGEFDGDVIGYLVAFEVATTAAFREWCMVLKRKYAARRLCAACSECTDRIDAGESVGEIITVMQDHLAESERCIDGRDRKTTGKLLASVAEEALNGNAEKTTIIPLCIPGTEDLIHRKKTLHILGAMPGVGKTAFVLNSILGRAKAGFTEALFCAETSAESIMKRLVSIEAMIPVELFDNFQNVKNNLQLTRYKRAMDTLRELKERIYIFGKGDYRHSPDGIRAELKRIQDELSGGLDAVSVDYLQNMRALGRLAKANRAEQLEEFTFALNETFGELNLAATVLCQLSRDKDRIKGNKASNIYDLKGSSAIEQEADFITFLHKANPQASGVIGIDWYSAKVRGSRMIDATLGYETMTSRYVDPPHRYDTSDLPDDLPDDVNSKRPYKEN